ncbi:MAG: amidohydrolase [Desulfobacter sp.]|nr:amidohydrolase [Desulfobacter sp.]
MRPDLILYNGQILTQDSPVASASAVAILGPHILALGSDSNICSMAGASTQTIDLDNRLVLPGFWDSHFHFFGWASQIDSLDLSKANCFADMEAMVQTRAKSLGAGDWVLGLGFNESDWPENLMPDKRVLDRLAPENPVCIWRCDCHLAVANSKALERAGINADFSPPQGAVVDRDGQGIPTGILKELAPNLISDVLPKLTRDQLMANMETAMARCHLLGMTGIHDVRIMGGVDGADALAGFQAFHNAGKLKLRTLVDLPGENTDQAVDLGLMSGFGDDTLGIGWLKFFADGGMGARTAWMTQDYLDGGRGMALTPVEEIEVRVRKADQAGLACMIHTLGDRACHEIIGIFQRLERDLKTQCRLPHRIEHLQLIRPKDVDRLKSLKNLALSCQANNLSLDISMIEQSVGPLGKYAYNFRRLMDTGLPFVFNSDAPVADPNPLCGIYSAVTRKRMDRTPEGGWYPDQVVSVAEAVRAYTITPARISGMGEIAGSLVPGKRADLVVLDRNIFKIPKDEIPDVQTWLTLFNGEIVYQN